MALQLGDLANHLADRAGGEETKTTSPSFKLAALKQAGVGGQARRISGSAQEGLRRQAVGVELLQGRAPAH